MNFRPLIIFALCLVMSFFEVTHLQELQLVWCAVIIGRTYFSKVINEYVCKYVGYFFTDNSKVK